MKEVAEFRVDEKFADRVFADNQGEKLGFIRRVKVATSDPQFAQIGASQRENRAKGNGPFFYGWDIRRLYNREEMKAATCFQMRISAVFEPPGEECGTKYDETTACPKCGSGAVQESDLRLDLRRVPKGKDVARTIAGEWIISQRLAEKVTDAGLTGLDLRLVRHRARYEDDPLDFGKLPSGPDILRKALSAGAPHPTGRFYTWINRAENRHLMDQARAENVAARGQRDRRTEKPMPVWHQLIVKSANAVIVPPTRVGINPFDDDPTGECRCSEGDLIGLALLSEVSIDASTLPDADIFCSRQFIGIRQGLLRPSRVIFISAKFRKLLKSETIKGFETEIAHVI